MINWNFFLYSFITILALLLSVMGLWLSVILPGIDRKSKRFFLAYFTIILLCSCTAILETILVSYQSMRWLLKIVLFLESIFLSLPLLLLPVYLLYCCGEDLRHSVLFRSVLGLWAVYFFMLFSSLFMDNMYSISPDNQLLLGPWYPLLILPLNIIAVLSLAGLVRRRAMLSRIYFVSFLVSMLPMTIALFIHLFNDVFAIIDICYAISALSMYGLILSDQIAQDRRQQQEIANQRASIMVLQMRPHFIFNTMTSIYCLCAQDPQKARQVTLDFTNYLRNNFSAIASSEPIPFSAELEHARAYLSVEQVQFEDSLFVDFDTPPTWFRVPPLTLQPIVENAVKHGMDPESGPLHICVRTRDTGSGSEILVEDDGNGFSPADDAEPHIALKNIRQRLELMCGGSLTITPRDGGGTVVRLFIPDDIAT